MVKQIETKEEYDTLLKESGNKLVVVDFFATWCPPCKRIAPEVEKLAEAHSNVVFVKVDVDKNAEAAEAEGISAMPTFIFYKNGKKVGEVVGADLEGIKKMVEDNN